MKLSRLATIGFGLTQANAMFNRFFRRGRVLMKISAICDHTRKKRDHKRADSVCSDSWRAKFIQKNEDYQVKFFAAGARNAAHSRLSMMVARACGSRFTKSGSGLR
ncbi:hypothetical protein [Thalassovita aquimarina]|uniref:hypothetical protein n=1 Tax=Thalassovita aquimarina TaxID=2785917 RepID=UPI0035612C17